MIPISSNRINVSALKLAREFRYLTQAELARMLKIKQGTLSKIEKEFLIPDASTVLKLADVLNFPVDFFYQEKHIIPVEGHYRRKMSTSVKDIKRYIAQMTLAECHLVAMLDEIELPEVNLPTWDVTTNGSPVEAAKYLRECWKLPKGKIDHMTKLVENNGVVVIPLELGEMDGFSTYVNGNVPVVFINSGLSSDRFRLTLAHELAHLILHFGNKVDKDRDVEAEAFALAIEFLVPEHAIRTFFTRLTIEKLADLKSYWCVSMQALLRYANTLRMVTDNQYRYLWTQMGTLGYRRKEPVSLPSETPGLIREAIDSYLTDLEYTKEELAKIFKITVSELERIYLNSPKGSLKIV